MTKTMQRALIVTSGRIGASVTGQDEATMDALRSAGLISATGHLTRKGLDARTEILDTMMEVEL